MARLIDADALMETIRAHFNSTDNGMFVLGIQQAVDAQPAVDAVEVVRCGECRKCATDDCCFFAHKDDKAEHYGKCGYGQICNYCDDSSKGRPCVRALNAMVREKHININYAERDFERWF